MNCEGDLIWPITLLIFTLICWVGAVYLVKAIGKSRVKMTRTITKAVKELFDGTGQR